MMHVCTIEMKYCELVEIYDCMTINTEMKKSTQREQTFFAKQMITPILPGFLIYRVSMHMVIQITRKI